MYADTPNFFSVANGRGQRKPTRDKMRRAGTVCKRDVRRRGALVALFLFLLVFAMRGIGAARAAAMAAMPVRSHDAWLPKLHFVYSLGCQTGHSGVDDEWQLLQALVLDHSFHKAGQRGRLTRLVSGCEAKEHARHLLMTLGNTETIFFPRNDKVDGKTYVQVNRPRALLEFFNVHVKDAPADTIYIVIDPDFVFRRRVDDQVFAAVAPGTMVTQYYGLNTALFKQWAKRACTQAGFTDECAAMDTIRSSEPFSVGVPYIMLRADWLNVLPVWLKFIPSTLRFYPGIESDMYAFVMASTLLQQRRVTRLDLMITCMWSERASLDDLRASTFLHLCQDYSVAETRGLPYRVNPTKEVWSETRRARHPNVTHAFVFNKHWLKTSKLQECGTPLLVEPPPIVGEETDTQDRWHRFLAHEAVAAYNDAMRAFKGPSCNTETRLIMHEMHRNTFGGRLNHVIDNV